MEKHTTLTSWLKHNGTKDSPVPRDYLIEVETWTARGNFKVKSQDLNWVAVKFYKVIRKE
jgi:hypothetical protein